MVRPLAGEKNGHAPAAVVRPPPRSLLAPGDAGGPPPFPLPRLDDRVGDGAPLPVGVAFANHEVIGDRRFLPDVEADDPPGLLLRSRIRNEPAELKGSHLSDYPSWPGAVVRPGRARAHGCSRPPGAARDRRWARHDAAGRGPGARRWRACRGAQGGSVPG